MPEANTHIQFFHSRVPRFQLCMLMRCLRHTAPTTYNTMQCTNFFAFHFLGHTFNSRDNIHSRTTIRTHDSRFPTTPTTDIPTALRKKIPFTLHTSRCSQSVYNYILFLHTAIYPQVLSPSGLSPTAKAQEWQPPFTPTTQELHCSHPNQQQPFPHCGSFLFVSIWVFKIFPQEHIHA